MPTYKPTFAYFDSVRCGLIPVRVTDYNPSTREITCKVTAGRGVYKKSETLVYSDNFVYPREAVYIRSGMYRIKSYCWQKIGSQINYVINPKEKK